MVIEIDEFYLQARVPWPSALTYEKPLRASISNSSSSISPATSSESIESANGFPGDGEVLSVMLMMLLLPGKLVLVGMSELRLPAV